MLLRGENGEDEDRECVSEAWVQRFSSPKNTQKNLIYWN